MKMTVIVALILAGMYTLLKPVHELNEAIYAKKAVLAALENKINVDAKTLSNEQVEEIFTNKIKQEVYDMNGNLVSSAQLLEDGYTGGLAENIDVKKEAKKNENDRYLPLYIYTDDKGEKTYVVQVDGKGLWDRIWGNIAIGSDLKTITGVDYDHINETPGLGAEIKDNTAWKNQFLGKTFVNKAGEITGVGVIKGGAKEPEWQVDGISGATITANGVDEMLKRGLTYYEPVLKLIKE